MSIGGRPAAFHNTNRLVASSGWDIGLSKTGFINEAGRCLVMQARLAGRGVVIVLLDSWGKYTRIADAARIRKWLEVADGTQAPRQHAPSARTATKTRKASARARAQAGTPVVATARRASAS